MSKIGKITIQVSQSRNGQTLDVSTTGRRGNVLLNTVSEHLVQSSQSPSATADQFWIDVMTRIITSLS